jgi:thiamine biosynthesis lipoprotein
LQRGFDGRAHGVDRGVRLAAASPRHRRGTDHVARHRTTARVDDLGDLDDDPDDPEHISGDERDSDHRCVNDGDDGRCRCAAPRSRPDCAGDVAADRAESHDDCAVGLDCATGDDCTADHRDHRTPDDDDVAATADDHDDGRQSMTRRGFESVAGDFRDRVVEHRWRAMGAAAHVVIVGGAANELEVAVQRIEALEAKWSRFRPTSELCRINAAAGAPVIVSRETVEIVQRAIDASESTGGRFDPTILLALEAAGYDRTFELIEASESSHESPNAGASNDSDHRGHLTPGCGAVRVDHVVGSVRVEPGVEIDLGGIGKGRAADLVARELFLGGADGVLVNLGGDLRAIGRAPTDFGWIIEIDPVFARPLGRVALGEGAVATSSQLTRAWSNAGERQHHLIEPRTGRPAASDLAAVTVIAGEAERAEVVAKAALLAGASEGAALLRDHDLPALMVLLDGTMESLAGFDRFRVPELGLERAA